MKTRVFIADADTSIVAQLELSLSCMPDVEFVGSATDGPQAVKLIRERQADVVVLDADLANQEGFAVADALAANDSPQLIISSSNRTHALRAFEINAADFLLKPITFERLRQSVRRAQSRIFALDAEARFAELHRTMSQLAAATAFEDRPPSCERYIWIKDRAGVARMPIEAFELLQAAGDYVIAYTSESSHFLSDSISSLESRLDSALMMRVHRSAIVGLDHVRALRRRSRHDVCLLMRSGKQVPVGRTYVASVMRVMGAHRWREQA